MFVWVWSANWISNLPTSWLWPACAPFPALDYWYFTEDAFGITIVNNLKSNLDLIYNTKPNWLEWKLADYSYEFSDHHGITTSNNIHFAGPGSYSLNW